MHQELADNFDPENRGYDFVLDNAEPMDVYGHGTHVAGTVAALEDGYGVVGVAPEAQIFALRILDDNGYGTTTRTLAALDWIYRYNEANPTDPIRITNNSYGGPTYSEAERQAFENVATSGVGVLHLAAAGNSGKKSISVDNVSYPAKYESVVAVAATDAADARASFSSTGPAVELAAPGVSVLSSWMYDTSYLNPQPFAFPDDDDYYKEGSGTSMASPHAAGTAALVWAANPGLSVQEVRGMLQNTALDLGASGRDTAYGFGRIQADAAVEAALKANGVPPPDQVSIAAMIDSSVFINAATWQATVEVTISPATPGAVITGTWSNGTTTTAITDGSGMCSHQVNVSKKLSTITFNIENVELTDFTFDPSDTDTITISKP